MKFYILSLVFFLSGSLYAQNHSDNSLFHLDAQWVNQDSQNIVLSSFKGKPFILSMIFLSCNYSCPITLQNLKALEKKIKEKTKQNLPIVLVSIDPKNDTPSAMKKYIIEKKLEPKNWTIISSKEDHVRELAAALGFSYRKDEAMGFAHSMLSWVIDAKGEVAFTREGQKQSLDDMATAAIKALQESK